MEEDTIQLPKDFQNDFFKMMRKQEVATTGQYDHNLTLKMLQIFLLGGGNGHEGDEYQHYYLHYKHAKLT